MKRLLKKFNMDVVKIVLLDAILIILSYYLAYYLRFGGSISSYDNRFFINSLPMVLMMKLYFINDFKLYKGDLRYVGIHDILSIFKALVIANVSIITVVWLSGLTHKLARGVIILDWCISILLIGGARVAPRIINEGFKEPIWVYIKQIIRDRKLSKKNYEDRKKTLIYGAGYSGQAIAKEMMTKRSLRYNPVGYIDDNKKNIGKIIHGLEVHGDQGALKGVVNKFNVSEIIISLPSIKRKELKKIIQLCEDTGTKTKIVPSLVELVDNDISVSHIRNIRVDDLLGRDPVKLNADSISGYLRNMRVLVTGAGGSIGSELCRQIMNYDPEMLVLFGRGENSIFEIHNELQAKYPNKKFPQVIGDVINYAKVEKIFDLYRPHIVFHAGADKHVPLMEMNPDEAVFNNIVGTKNVILASDNFRVERLICISTDKAVNPTSMMGACKRIAEMLIQSRNKEVSKRTEKFETKVMAVRFGNVLGSRGSVIPVFEKQIENGGPVTVTDKNMERYLMTIPEASQLVVQSGAFGDNGDKFVLDMGEPVKIDNLARTMIKLAGLKPEEDIEIVYTGIRPGEKLYEELALGCEKKLSTDHPKVIKIIEDDSDLHMEKLEKDIEELRLMAIDMDYEKIYKKVSEMIPYYFSDDTTVVHQRLGAA